MKNTVTELRNEERAMLELSALFRSHGYSRFKMSRFEEYELYAGNKDFLVSDRMITFTDRSGRLLALKPDVTMSIIRSSSDQPGQKRRVYYNESVYRADKDGDFREIMQTGLECIGDITPADVAEVTALAAESLKKISPDYALDISHLGITRGILDEAGYTEDALDAALGFVRQKNAPELRSLGYSIGIPDDMIQKASSLCSIYGKAESVIADIARIATGESARSALFELRELSDALNAVGLGDNVNIDFSVGGDLTYYNGIVFQGYVKGIPTDVLTGGRYDKLMKRMGKRSGAIGFAVYLDALEQLAPRDRGFDFDVLLLVPKDATPAVALAKAEELRQSGKSVYISEAVPERLRFAEKIALSGGAK